MHSELTFSMKNNALNLRSKGLFSWQEQAAALADEFTEDEEIKRLVTPETYDLISRDYDARMEPQGKFGDFVTVEAFEELAEKLLLALELIKIMEENQAHEL